MAHINLLPWREELRAARRKQFLVALASSVAISGAVWFGAESYINSMIEGQTQRNAYLDQEIAAVDKKLKEIEELEKTRRRLEERMRVIGELQQSRPQIVHLLDEVVRTLPEGVYLSSIKQNGSGVEFKGVAQSNARVSAYMRNIEASSWVGQPLLGIIEKDQRKSAAGQDEAAGESRFVLSAKQITPKKEGDDEGG